MNANDTYKKFIREEVAYRLREVLNDEVDTSGLTRLDIIKLTKRIASSVDVIDYEKLDNAIRDSVAQCVAEKKETAPAADEIEDLANKIYELLTAEDLWFDTRIYFNGKAYEAGPHGEKKVIENINPRDYFEYAGDILSMSFEGPLYDEFNYSRDWEFEGKFSDLLRECGYYYELGNAWNLTLYRR